jgi:hypothetical protein
LPAIIREVPGFDLLPVMIIELRTCPSSVIAGMIPVKNRRQLDFFLGMINISG